MVAKQGSRTDLNGFKRRVEGYRRFNDIYDDPESLEVVAKYPRFARQLYNRTRPPPPQLELELRPWQNRLVELLDGSPVKRRIIWVWSLASSTGKSTMLDYMISRKEVLVVQSSNINDVMYAYDEHDIIWYNVPRSTPLDAKFSSMLETLSDGGMIPSNKYESCNKRVNAHIVVTCNRAPIKDRLPDRIEEIHIEEPEIPLVPYDPTNNCPEGGWRDELE